MFKALLIATPLCVLLALVGGSATRGSPELSKPGTIRVTTKVVDDHLIDRGTPGRGPGDLRVTRQLVYNPGLTPKAIGHSDLVCTYTTSYARQCSGTFTLPKGKIVVAGAITFRQFYELAVVGGTGLYDNVRGSLTVTLLRRHPQREIVLFRLLV
jgi:hypothetical protein